MKKIILFFVLSSFFLTQCSINEENTSDTCLNDLDNHSLSSSGGCLFTTIYQFIDGENAILIEMPLLLEYNQQECIELIPDGKVEIPVIAKLYHFNTESSKEKIIQMPICSDIVIENSIKPKIIPCSFSKVTLFKTNSCEVNLRIEGVIDKKHEVLKKAVNIDFSKINYCNVPG